MMSRTQITIEDEMQRRARQRASALGVSFAEYVRNLVTRDLARPVVAANVTCIFDLGDSGSSDVARNKDMMVAEAFAGARSASPRG